jgi:hypothetical protein
MTPTTTVTVVAESRCPCSLLREDQLPKMFPSVHNNITMLAAGKKIRRSALTGKESRLNASSTLVATSDTLRSVSFIQDQAKQAMREGKTQKALRLFNQVSNTVAVATTTIDKQASLVNDEQTHLSSRAAKSIAYHLQLAKHQNNVPDPGKLHEAKMKDYRDAHSENEPTRKRKVNCVPAGKVKTRKLSIDSTASSSSSSSSTISSLTEPDDEISVWPRYKGIPTLPPSLRGKIEKPLPPQNKSFYQPPEAMAILANIAGDTSRKKRENEKISVLLRAYWIDTNLVTVRDVTLRKQYSRYKKGEPVNDFWNQKGRPRYMTPEAILAAGTLLMERNEGRALRSEDWKKIIHDYQRESAVLSGLDPNTVTLTDPSQYTLNMYQHTFRHLNPSSVAIERKQVIEKSEARDIAESSLMSAVCLALVTGATHFYPCPPDEPPFVPDDDATDGAKKFYELMKKALGGGDIGCVSPFLVTSTDDMNSFIFKGTVADPSKKGLVLIGDKAFHNRHHRSAYSEEEQTAGKKGRRVKFGTTGTAAGQAMQPYLIVGGLTEEELPTEQNPDGVLIMELDSFSVGGTVDPENEGTGYVCFLRSGTNASIKRFQHQHDCFLRFITRIRKQRGLDADNGTCVSWNDGALDQLAANRGDLDKFDKERVITNKQNPARTGTEQPEDLQRKYPMIRKQASVSSCYEEDDQLKSTLQKNTEHAFDIFAQEGRLMLIKSHREAIVDYVCTLPEIIGKAFCSSIIKQGFIENGMIDANRRRSPDFYKMIKGTTRRKISKEEMANVLEQFPSLIDQQLSFGFVDDTKLEAAGITPDTNRAGNIVRREFGYRSEHRHRAKTLSHDMQKQQRLLVTEGQKAEVRRKQLSENATIQRLLDDSFKAFRAIALNYETRTRKVLTQLVDATIEDIGGYSDKTKEDKFEKAKKANDARKEREKTTKKKEATVKIEKTTAVPGILLKAFIHCRLFTTSTKDKTYRWAKRGCTDDALRGRPSLVLEAFMTRSQVVRLSLLPIVNDDAPAQPSRTEEVPRLSVNCIVGVGEDMEYLRHEVTDEWIRLAADTFEGIDDTWDLEEVKRQSAGLFTCLKKKMRRFNGQLQSGKDHWVWSYSRRNLSRVCTLLVLLRWIRDDVLRFEGNYMTSLLTNPDRKVHRLLYDDNDGLTAYSKEVSGVYVFYSTENTAFIRSGKSQRVFHARLREHEQASHLTTVASRKNKFYTSYPSKDTDIARHGNRMGYFENLEAYSLLGMRTENIDDDVLNEDGDGLFNWSGGVQQSLRYISHKVYRKEQKIAIVQYLVEHVVELCMAQHDVVSESKGYEKYIKGDEEKAKASSSQDVDGDDDE